MTISEPTPVMMSIIRIESGSICSARSMLRPSDWTQFQRVVTSRRSSASRVSIAMKMTTVATNPSDGQADGRPPG